MIIDARRSFVSCIDGCLLRIEFINEMHYSYSIRADLNVSACRVNEARLAE